MKYVAAFLLLFLSLAAQAEDKKPTTLRGVLLEQLQTTHDKKDWFAPASVAVEGITAEQASWRDGKGNHSIGQLAAHLVFWNSDQLAKVRRHPRSAATTTRPSTPSRRPSGPRPSASSMR